MPVPLTAMGGGDGDQGDGHRESPQEEGGWGLVTIHRGRAPGVEE